MATKILIHDENTNLNKNMPEEQFIKPVLAIIAISMLVWILFWFLFSIFKKNRGLRISLRAELIFFLFYIYIVGVMSLTVLPLPFTRFKTPNEDGINIIPVVNIVKGLLEIISKRETLSEHSFQNIFGNIILFIPLGVFLPIVSNKYSAVYKVAGLACACSVSIELTQLILRQFEIYRSVDIDDVILNTSGAVLGVIVFKKFYFN